MLSPASPPGPALGPALREGLKLGPGPSPTFKARARPELVFLGPDPSLALRIFFSDHGAHLNIILVLCKQQNFDCLTEKYFLSCAAK